jgi:hypothetical protein
MAQSEYVKGLALLAWISAEILGATGVGVLIGLGLHRWWGISKIVCLPLALAGLVLAFWRIYRASRQMEKGT